MDCILFRSVCYSKPGRYDKLSKLGCIYILMYIRTYVHVCVCLHACVVSTPANSHFDMGYFCIFNAKSYLHMYACVYTYICTYFCVFAYVQM